ncbi:hypothetical protein B0H14DRAFT_2765972 [Mycena olivaceomarginata]|nr:hypothetical protein B0H14DRAFT_2765972 [Mycena olivaceomarginata]
MFARPPGGVHFISRFYFCFLLFYRDVCSGTKSAEAFHDPPSGSLGFHQSMTSLPSRVSEPKLISISGHYVKVTATGLLRPLKSHSSPHFILTLGWKPPWYFSRSLCFERRLAGKNRGREDNPGTAHVLFTSPIDAQTAVGKLHAHVFKGSLLSVTLKKRLDTLAKPVAKPGKAVAKAVATSSHARAGAGADERVRVRVDAEQEGRGAGDRRLQWDDGAWGLAEGIWCRTRSSGA